jgi:hypothetical protein
MIISASINADVPAHHGEWFTQRLDAGYCRIARTDGLTYPRVLLTRDVVEGFVFWTRCVEPFLPVLDRIRGDGFAFTVQFAVTGYPRDLDPAPVSAESGAEQLAGLARKFGPRVAVWRYDPLLVTPATPPDWHGRNFERIAQLLAGVTDEAVLAFARPDRKLRLARRGAVAPADPDPGEKRDLVKTLVQIAGRYGMRLTVCAQPDSLAPGAAPARCIDARRLAAAAGRPIVAETAGFWPGCLCAQATDIGDRHVASAGYFCGAMPKGESRAHDADEEFLFPVARRFTRARGEDLPF